MSLVNALRIRSGVAVPALDSSSLLTLAGVNRLLLSNAGTATPLRILNALTNDIGGAVVITNAFLRVDGGISTNAFYNDGSLTLLNGGRLLLTNLFTQIGIATNASLTIRGGSATVGDLDVGDLETGTLTVSGGTLTLLGDSTSILFVGDFIGATGSVWVTGGTVLLTNDFTYIGYGGVGQMTISNVTVQASDVVVGETGQGTLTVAGGTLSLLYTLIVGEFDGAGAVWLTNGQLLVPNDETLIGSGGTGRLTISNGTMQASTVTVGAFNPGTLTVAGGTMTVSESIIFGDCPLAASGYGVLSGGNLSVIGTPPKAVLEVRSGTFIMTGGTLDVDNLVLTNSCGHFVHTGGTLNTRRSPLLDPNFDADADGFSNQNELDAGTDPLDPTSKPGTVKIYPPGDVNATNGVTSADSLLINQVLVGLRSSNDAIFATAGFGNGDVNQDGRVTSGDSLLINQQVVGLRSFIVTKIVPNVRNNNLPTAVTIFGIGFPTNTVTGVTIGLPVNLTLSSIVVISREQITAVVPAGGGIGTGTVNVVATPTNGVISFGRFINQ